MDTPRTRDPLARLVADDGGAMVVPRSSADEPGHPTPHGVPDAADAGVALPSLARTPAPVAGGSIGKQRRKQAARITEEAIAENVDDKLDGPGEQDGDFVASSADAAATPRDEPAAVLRQLDSAVEQAMKYAERWTTPYRPEIFRVALGQLLASGGAEEAASWQPVATGADPGRRSVSVGAPLDQPPTGQPRSAGLAAPSAAAPAGRPGTGNLGPIDKLARALGVDVHALGRALLVSDDGKFSFLGRLAGTTKKELQTRYSLAYLYVKEMAFGNRLVDIEELRALCIDQGCYDLGNFTSNFKKDVVAGLLREQGEKGVRARRYMLSQKGVSEGAALLRVMIEQ